MTEKKLAVRVRKRVGATSPSAKDTAQAARTAGDSVRQRKPPGLKTENVSTGALAAAAEESRDYAVGYKKPPKHTRFKPGRSGNPKGRPKACKNFKTDLLEELGEQIAVREGGRRRTVSKQRAMLKSLTAKAMQGDARAAGLVANMVFRFLQQEEEPEDRHDLPAEDLAILKAYQNRVQRESSTPRHRRTDKGENHE